MLKDENNSGGEHRKHVLRFTINRKEYEWTQQYITGAEIRTLGNIPPEDEIFLAIKRPWEDEKIDTETKVDLARPEVEHFISKPKTSILIVNGREKPWNKEKINYEEVVILAFGTYDNNPNVVYTVTYDRGPHENKEGTMVKGSEAFIKNKMVFNVTATNRS